MRTFFQRLARHQVPPSGVSVRVFLALMLFIGAIVRSGIPEVTYLVSPNGYDKLLGVLSALAGIALIGTVYNNRRLTLGGRIAAGFSFGVFVSIALSTPSSLGMLTNVLCSLCAFTETVTVTEGEREPC